MIPTPKFRTSAARFASPKEQTSRKRRDFSSDCQVAIVVAFLRHGIPYEAEGGAASPEAIWPGAFP